MIRKFTLVTSIVAVAAAVPAHAHDLGFAGLLSKGNVEELPEITVERLRHYFLTYKSLPGETSVSIAEPYGRQQAEAVIRAAMQDYENEYGGE